MPKSFVYPSMALVFSALLSGCGIANAPSSHQTGTR